MVAQIVRLGQRLVWAGVQPYGVPLRDARDNPKTQDEMAKQKNDAAARPTAFSERVLTGPLDWQPELFEKIKKKNGGVLCHVFAKWKLALAP